jgi:serine/threonine protein phosphatase PrpC
VQEETNHWSACGGTDTGKERENNEDRIHCDAARGIFVVVDGMGGEVAGEEAAQVALVSIRKRLEQKTGTPARRIREAITAANNEIYRAAEARPEWRGMACVLTAAVIEDGNLHIGHVGDTRLYSIRPGRIRKITRDHSPIGTLEDEGKLHELEAMRNPRRNEVFRDVGSAPRRLDEEEFIDSMQVPFEPDSAYLICSDGLTDMVPSAEILRIVTRNPEDPRRAVEELIDAANEAGGKDNVSIVLVTGREFGRESARPALSFTGAAAASTGGAARVLMGRWAVFLYGIALGAVLLTLLPSPPAGKSRVSGNAPERPIERPALVVDPAGAELPTIASALEKARAGDRIEVVRGEYNERIRLKEGVSLIARNPGEVVIRPAQNEEGEAAVVAEGIKSGALSGLVIRPGPGASLPVGMRISDADVRVSDVEISGTSRAGISIEGSARPEIAGSYIHSNLGTGIVARGTSAPRLVANVIVRNGTGGGTKRPGIEILEESSPEVVRNVISENGVEGIRSARPGFEEKLKNNFFVSDPKSTKRGAPGRTRR